MQRSLARSAVAALVAASCIASPRAAPKKPAANPVHGGKTGAAVLFAISPIPDSTQVMVDPVLFVRSGKLSPVPHPGPDGDTATSRAFAREYYRPGKTYRVVFGGAPAGSVRVVREMDESGGATMAAFARLEKSRVRLGGAVNALATDATALTLRPNGRRSPSARERTAALAMAQETFRNKGIPAADVEKVSVYNLTACDLDGDRDSELIGSFAVIADRREHNLFCILEPIEGGGFRYGRTEYHPAKDEYAVDRENEYLLDAVDLDNDGNAEVVTRSDFYEWWEYTVYRKTGGAWRAVYSAHGGGL